MDSSERKQVIASIDQQTSELQSQIEQLKNNIKPVAPDDAIGRLTRMEAIASKGVNETNLNDCRLRLEKLQHCRQQVDDEDFGYCQSCDEPIPLARLLLVPDATVCVACAQKEN